MKSNLHIILVVIAAVIISAWALFTKTTSSGLASPFAAVQILAPPTPTPSPSPTPIEYNFDKSTDLKTQLNSVNPEIKDSDFNDLRNLNSQL